MKMIVLLSALAGSASVVFAQGTLPAYPLESEIRLEVWNGTSWGNTVNASPGQQVEYRVVINYTGPRTDLLGLGDSRYQPTFSNADNVGVSKDTLVAFPGDGTSTYTQNMLTAADGASGAALPAYGRVTYGGYAQSQTNPVATRLRVFRHGGESPQAGAPVGSWLRVSGEGVPFWPVNQIPTAAAATADAINSNAKGVSAMQLASVFPLGSGVVNTHFAGGVNNLVVFRHAIILSDSDAVRSIQISVAEGSILREGTVGSADDRRYVNWHESVTGFLATYRTSVAIVPATIVIPTPGALAMLSLTGAFASRRRR